MRTLLALALTTGAATAQASCPTGMAELCLVAADAAAAVSADLPKDIRQMEVLRATALDTTVLVEVTPFIGGPYPEQTDAARFLCGYPAARALLERGGRVDVLMDNRPFLGLTTCEAQ